MPKQVAPSQLVVGVGSKQIVFHRGTAAVKMFGRSLSRVLLAALKHPTSRSNHGSCCVICEASLVRSALAAQRIFPPYSLLHTPVRASGQGACAGSSSDRGADAESLSASYIAR